MPSLCSRQRLFFSCSSFLPVDVARLQLSVLELMSDIVTLECTFLGGRGKCSTKSSAALLARDTFVANRDRPLGCVISLCRVRAVNARVND